MAGFEPPDTVYGVDFSAAARDAGRNTWIAECTPRANGLVVDRLADAAEFMECDPGREATLAELVDLIGEVGDTRRAFGLDFPFGLPRDLLGDLASWQEFVEGASEDDWGELGSVDGPQALYDRARDLAETDEVDLLRTTDEEHGGQEPTGYRIKTQTFYGISALLVPLASVEGISIVPMDDFDAGTVVLETYPRAVFERIGATVEGYKRDTCASIDWRLQNVEALESKDVAFGDPERRYALASDDALDAVAAAYAAWQATKAGEYPNDLLDDDGEVAEPYRGEGYIFC